jgi:hypothetical protein
MPTGTIKKRAWLVARPALLELQDDQGRVIRRMIYVRSSMANDERARDMLDREAATLGYVVVGERRESRRWPRAASAVGAGETWQRPALAVSK